MPSDKQDAKSEEGHASNIRDIEASNGGQVNVQSEVKRHSHPKPHNEDGTAQFNGLASLFLMLSKVVPPQYFDVIFGASTVGGLLGFAYWFFTEVYAQFPSKSMVFPEYVLIAIGATVIGAIYLSVREGSQCPQCETPFALRRKEREVERDKHQDQPDELLIRREEACSSCGYESDERFWREERSDPSEVGNV